MSTEAAEAISDKEVESEEPQEKAKAQGAPKLEEEEQDLKVWRGMWRWGLLWLGARPVPVLPATQQHKNKNERGV